MNLSTYLAKHAGDADLAHLLDAVASACWSISSAVARAALDGHRGGAGAMNVQGEDQMQLDVLANDLFMQACGRCPRLAAAVSEEVEDVTWLKQPEAGDFLLAFDPLDGSSNLDVDLSVGSIFAVSRFSQGCVRDVGLPGRDVICAGYAIYGPSTMLVLTFGDRVDGFTLDTAGDEFVLTHADMRIPRETAEFAINVSRQRHWDEAVRAYVEACLAGPQGPRGRAFNMRWTASMVAEVHRILIRGGVFLYPRDAENADKGGKLRLMYEAIPMAMISKAAGGGATDGLTPILDLSPVSPHQRVSVILGSQVEVDRIATHYAALT